MAKARSHGHARREYKRKDAASLEGMTYKTWTNMKSRCNDSNRHDFMHYGGRGIRVCEHWLTYDNFLADIGLKPSPKHTIDRINPDGNYEPGNCRWLTHLEQQRNRKNIIRIRCYSGPRGEKTIQEWSAIAGISTQTIYHRLTHGYCAKLAVFGTKNSRKKGL
jgi:hypothetical protein